MSKSKPTYQQLESRLAELEPIIEALKGNQVDAVVGDGKIAFLLLHKVEEALVESNEEFNALFELSGVGMVQADTPALRFTRVNQRFCEMAGYTAEELLTKTYIGFTHPQDRQRDMKELTRVLRATADAWAIEKRCVRRDGGVIWVDVHGVALRDATGRVVRIMAMISDITSRKQAEQEQGGAQGEPQQRVGEQAVRRALSDVQRFIDQAIGRPPGESSAQRPEPKRPKKPVPKKALASGHGKPSDPRRPKRR